MNDETEKRDNLIYEVVNSRYALEEQRTCNLEQKAQNIISFVGIMLILQAGSVGLIINEIPKVDVFYIAFSLLYVLSIFNLICSIYCSLKAYQVKKWILIPDTEYLIEEYAEKERNITDILRILSVEISNAIKHNEKINDVKAKLIQYSLFFLTIGVGLIVISTCSLLLVRMIII